MNIEIPLSIFGFKKKKTTFFFPFSVHIRCKPVSSSVSSQCQGIPYRNRKCYRAYQSLRDGSMIPHPPSFSDLRMAVWLAGLRVRILSHTQSLSPSWISPSPILKSACTIAQPRLHTDYQYINSNHPALCTVACKWSLNQWNSRLKQPISFQELGYLRSYNGI